MKKGLTELVLILDKSGSMGGLEGDTIGGYNAMLEKQKAVAGECRITTVLFDNYYELLHDRIDLRAVSPITEEEYQVGGSTALLDAIGRTLHKIKSVQKHTADEYRAEKVLFVIITDGAENASREYTSEKIKAQIEHQKAKYGWEFIFLGANIDAVETAARYGIGRDRAQNYYADAMGSKVAYEAVACAASSLRTGMPLGVAWKEEAEADFNRRGGKSQQ